MDPQPVQNTFLPALNASLNAAAALLLLIGFVLIKQRRFEAHKKVMLTAFLVSAAFLSSYLYYHFNYVSSRFGGQGWIRPLYFTILISHITLATLMVPFILRLLYLAFKNALDGHSRLARIVWPVWMYTSVTGVFVYFMLYHWFPGGPRA